MVKKSENLGNEILRIVNKKLLRGLLIGLALLTGITGLSLWGIKNRTEKIVIDRIVRQFEEPRIQELLKEVAEDKAKEIIENRLNPSIEKANLTIDNKLSDFESNIKIFKERYEKNLDSLSEEMGYLKKRSEILQLGDAAIATGEAAPFEELENIYNSTIDNEIKMVALAEIFRVKNQFSLMTRIKGIDVKYTNPQTGKEFTEEEIPTEALIQGLEEAQHWQFRARITELLKGRKEKQVPEALLEIIRNDKQLEVRKKAMDSFESITGFTSRDVFKYKPAKEWWDKNKEEIKKNLKDLQTMEKAIKKNSEN